MQSSSPLNLTRLASLLLLPPLLCFGFDLPHPAVSAIFMTAIGLWLTEALPLPVTGLLIPLLAALYGVTPPAQAFGSFGNDILYLFLGCFLMSRAMEKYGFDKRLAYFLLGRCMPGSSFRSVNMVVAFAAFALSMWISNTSATAILTAVALGILTSLEQQIPDESVRRRVAIRLLLGVAFAASIGGIATPVGSPPNLIAISFLEREGMTISFVEWIAFALPVSLLMLGSMVILFELCLPVGVLTFPGIQAQFRALLRELGPMSRGERAIAAIFVATVILWVLPSALLALFPDNALVTTLHSRLSMSVVGLLGGIATFLVPQQQGDRAAALLTWDETAKLDWGTLMLFGGGLTLGLLLEQSGAAKDLSTFLFHGEVSNLLLLGALLTILSIALSEFASNTAAAAILIPLLLAMSAAQGLSPEMSSILVLATTFGASFGFMLPVSTPPNAIVYGTGRVPASEMRRVGFLFDSIGAVIIVGFLSILIATR